MDKIRFKSDISSAPDHSSVTVSFKFESYDVALSFKGLVEHLLKGTEEMIKAQKEMDEGL